MSNSFHNKWHRHNHHTNNTFPLEPDCHYDPIASPSDPFQGDFVINGSLTAININIPLVGTSLYNGASSVVNFNNTFAVAPIVICQLSNHNNAIDRIMQIELVSTDTTYFAYSLRDTGGIIPVGESIYIKWMAK